jgi:hypothetical protein
MSKWNRLLALLLAVALTVSLCLGNGALTALAAEISTSTIEDENVDVESSTEQETKEEENEETTSNEEENQTISDETKQTESSLQVPETDEENAELDMEAIEKVAILFANLPDADDVAELSDDEVDAVMQDTLDAMDAFDALTYDECEYFTENYPQLYQAVMVDLSNVLAGFYNNDVEVMSLLPLEEIKAYLILDEEESKLRQMPVDEVIFSLVDSDGNDIEIDKTATTVWKVEKDDEDNIETYQEYAIGENQTMDLSGYIGVSNFVLELIIGRGGQLDANNKRYIVSVYIGTGYTNEVTIDLYAEDIDGNRTKITPNRLEPTTNEQFAINFTLYFIDAAEPDDNVKYYIGIDPLASERPDVSVSVNEAVYGVFTGSDISNCILDQDMTRSGSGYEVEYGAVYYFIVTYHQDKIGDKTEIVVVSVQTDSYIEGNVFSRDGNELNEVVCRTNDSINVEKVTIGDSVSGTAVHNLTYMLNDGYDVNSEYYCLLNAYGVIYGDQANSYVIKAVEGNYDSLEAAEVQEDIKEQLIPVNRDDASSGYLANYNAENGGVTFTIFFDDDSIWKVNVSVTSYDPSKDPEYVQSFTEMPIIGSQDPWFQVTGAEDTSGKTLDTYAIENGKNINIDTMYGYGYQTVFINQDVEQFVPTFWRANDDAISVDKIYANGSTFNEGDVLTFPDGENTLTAIFGVIIRDSNGEHTKNYNVTFVKKTHGAQLYVAGPLAPEVRSVFLDEYHENKHDIFIANVGDEGLTDLWLDLDATNVELDAYWTIGGEGNNTLAACPDNFSLELGSTSYGELSNVAKIRLVPPSSGKGGEISGTLKIYSGKEGDAANSELLATINLSDLAQNPEITTTSVDDAVLYVPYSYLITTNNMYDWVNVSYELVDGELPDGVELIEETGEIYGVPQETGTFTFTVSTYFESTSEKYAFTPSTVELTLTVKDNTNSNVYNASDEGYSIEQAIGTDAGGYDFVLEEYADEVFWSEGVLVQFVDLWLNGEKLVEGEDYIAEDGSTKITIRAETFSEKADKDGANTIAAEFRTTDTDSKNTSANTNELKRTAQNFRIEIKQTGTEDGTNDEKNNSNGGTGGNTNSGTTSGGNTNSNGNTGGNSDSGAISGGNTNSNGSTGENTNSGITSGGNTNSGESTGGNTSDGSAAETNDNAGTATTIKTVTCTFHIVDADGNAIAGLSLELHSTPQYATTDGNGNATFSGVEFGKHTLYVKDQSGNTLATKSFELVEGSSVTMNGNSVATPNQTSIVLNVVYDNGSISIKSAEQSSNFATPKTGDDSHLAFWIIALMVATLGIAVLGVYVTHNATANYATRKKTYEPKRLVR